MVQNITLNDKPTKLKIVIQTNRREKLWIKVSDAKRKNTFYTKRYAFVEGKQEFIVLMPQAPTEASVIVYNDLNGLVRNDNSFSVVEIKALPYVLPKTNFTKKTQAFVKFAQEFCDECGYISASPQGDIYKSNNGRFRIDYFDKIRKPNGEVVKTPARISQISGKIEVSAEQFRVMTIPMRMAILLHEYSHYYVNKDPSNEIEADLNGLNIYLKLGYPKIDIYNVFLNVFKTAPSNANKERFDRLDNMVKNFVR
jgi:hypothetical protein